MKNYTICFFILGLFVASCTKEDVVVEDYALVFRIQFDSTLPRLNNDGSTAVVPAGHAAQSPAVKAMSADFIALRAHPDSAAVVLYEIEKRSSGGEIAIDFGKSAITAPPEVIFAAPLKNIPAGEYEWLQISLSYQQADVLFYIDTLVNDSITVREMVTGQFNNYLAYNTFLEDVGIDTTGELISENKAQGFWQLEGTVQAEGFSELVQFSGQAGNTTVINIQPSIVVPTVSTATIKFLPAKLVITGNEDQHITVQLSISTNNSIEWEDVNADGRWEPAREKIVDAGVRGIEADVR